MIKMLKYLRTKKGISQAQLANLLGLSQQSINKYENHNIEPDIATLIRIADYFGTTVDFLIGRSADKENAEISVERTLCADEEALLVGYRTLSANEQLCVRTFIRALRMMDNEKN